MPSYPVLAKITSRQLDTLAIMLCVRVCMYTTGSNSTASTSLGAIIDAGTLERSSSSVESEARNLRARSGQAHAEGQDGGRLDQLCAVRACSSSCSSPCSCRALPACRLLSACCAGDRACARAPACARACSVPVPVPVLCLCLCLCMCMCMCPCPKACVRACACACALNVARVSLAGRQTAHRTTDTGTINDFNGTERCCGAR